MGTFLIQGRYSSGAWARMIKITDDRSTAARDLVESLGGKLEGLWWDVDYLTAFAMAQLPDSVTAAALVTTLSNTGSFVLVEAHELLDQAQLHDALLMAKDVAQTYRVPGYAAVDRDDF